MRTCYPCFVLAASGRSFLSAVLALPVTPKGPDILEVVERPVIASISMPSPSTESRRNIPASAPVTPENTHIVFLTPAIIASLILFIAFTAILLSLFFFKAEIRTFVQRLKRHKSSDPEQEQELGQESKQEPKPELEENQDAATLGFGFDGLNNEELESARLKEEKEALKSSLSIEIPDSPPSLVLKYHSESPLSPIRAEGSSLEGHGPHDTDPIQANSSVPLPTIDRANEKLRDDNPSETHGKELYVTTLLALSPTSTAVSEASKGAFIDERHHLPALPFHSSDSTATGENLG